MHQRKSHDRAASIEEEGINGDALDQQAELTGDSRIYSVRFDQLREPIEIGIAAFVLVAKLDVKVLQRRR